MSTTQEPDAEKRSTRRRRPNGSARKPRGPRKTVEESANAEPRVKKERPASLPLPADAVGKKLEGLVSAIIRRGRLKFGFINLGLEEKPEGETPRVYFSFTELAEPELFLRRGYPVHFTCLADEKGRPYASGVQLTENGKQIAVERDAAAAVLKAERAASGEARPPREKKERAPRERRVVEPKPITLRVTCEGHADAKHIEFDAAQSIGKLKNVATTAFEAPVTYNVFYISAANPAGVFLTKAILSGLAANETIHLSQPREEAK